MKECDYRQIAISSVLCIVFDIIILDSDSKSLVTDVYNLDLRKAHPL